ncbi:MAG: metal ABC transporter substrate-binding protein [Mobilitalea sp.]
MRNKLLRLLAAMALLIIIIALVLNFTKPNSVSNEPAKKQLRIVTTFYPIYLIGENLSKDINEITLESLAEMNTGCLHDYQLTTRDMKAISKADVLIINGGGMEGFLDDIKENYPKLTIIDASEGITMLENTLEHEHEDELTYEDELNQENGLDSDVTPEEEHNHGEYNSHVWLDPSLYMKQIENVNKGLVDYILSSDSFEDDLKNKLEEGITNNASIYTATVDELNQRYLATIKDSQERNAGKERPQAVIFHDAFSYLAELADITIAHAVPLEPDSALSAAQIAEIVDEVIQDKIKYLLIEEQFSDSIAKQIQEETDAKLYIIDSVVTGDGALDSYITAMEKNLLVIQKILK